MNNKCPHCGTINWVDAQACVRCKKSPSEAVVHEPEEQVFGIERLRQEMGDVKMPTSRKVLLGILAAVSLFCLINYLRSSNGTDPAAMPPDAAAASANANAAATPPVTTAQAAH